MTTLDAADLTHVTGGRAQQVQLNLTRGGTKRVVDAELGDNGSPVCKDAQDAFLAARNRIAHSTPAMKAAAENHAVDKLRTAVKLCSGTFSDSMTSESSRW